MGTTLFLSSTVAPSSEYSLRRYSYPPEVLAPDGPAAVLPEPPALGEMEHPSRKQALALSAVIYASLVAGVMGITLATPVLISRPRTVAVVLDGFEAAPAPPPPPAGSAVRARTETRTPSSPMSPTPSEPIQAVRPAQESIPDPTGALPNANGSVLGGVAGGVSGGVAGGVLHGQVGGTVGGQIGGVVAPRFDAAYLKNPEPDYPLLSKRLGEEGRVLLRVLVTPEGLPDQVEIRQTSGHARLDQAALATVKRWRFTPARQGEERIAAWVLVPLSFQLEG